VPPEQGGAGETGMIAAALVEAVGGPGQPPPSQSGQGRAAAPGRAPAVVVQHRPVELFGWGDVGLTSWLAHQTFGAVLGHSFGPVFGGGVDVNIRGRIFVQGSVERFEENGQRVFVSNGQVFRLGIADTVRVIPVSATAGYRRDMRNGAWYVGAGAGTYLYKETSDFADPSENLDQRFTSYHALAGVEFGSPGPLRTAFEVQFTSVPNALGFSGASAAFGEQNLGGVQVRLKVLAGR
jgi:hypothetical protein